MRCLLLALFLSCPLLVLAEDTKDGGLEGADTPTLFGYELTRLPSLEETREAAEAGDATAQERLGSLFERGRAGAPKIYEEAARWYLKAAEQGHPDAQHKLATLYSAGRGVPQDDAEATKWLRRAAEQGHQTAQNNLGISLRRGTRTPKDEAEAAYWFRKAAEQGFRQCQFYLAEMLAEGSGVPQDDYEAYVWLLVSEPGRSVSPTSKRAQLTTTLMQRLSAEQIKQATAQAAATRERIAERRR
jgi:hypothetical protein